MFNMKIFFFSSFRPFPLVRGSHSISSFFTSFCLQHLSPLHQLPPYLLSLHLKIFSLVSLFSFPVIPFPSSFFLHTLHMTWSLLMTCPYHLILPSLMILHPSLWLFFIAPYPCWFSSLRIH